MSDCIYTREDLKRDYLDWVKINTNVVNISRVLNNLINTKKEMNVQWLVYDQNGNLIEVDIPNLASIISNIRKHAISIEQFNERSNTVLTSILSIQLQVNIIKDFIKNIELTKNRNGVIGINAKYLEGLNADKFERRDIPQSRLGDVVFTNYTDGVVLTDRITNKQYRLYVANGNLGIEEV